MSCKIVKSSLSGNISCPANKSYTHRAVFVASLTKGTSIIENVLRSADTDATILACKKFGAHIEDDGNVLKITNDNVLIKPAEIDAANSGTTIRIAAAIASLGNGKSTLTGDSSLQKRPMKPLLDALKDIGAKCSSEDGCPPITVEGPIFGGEVTIPGNISSQFVSALLLVGPLTKNGIILNIEGELVSKPYLDATISTMKKFGATVEETLSYKKYSIPNQSYVATNFSVPSDLSSLALLLSAAALVGDELSIDVKIDDLPQGDKAFFDILKKLGVEINMNNDSVKISAPAELNGGRFDLGDTPDLLPPLAILSAKTKNPIEIFNVQHARYKETDRIKIICRELRKIGLSVQENKDGMILQRTNSLVGANFDSENDHRLFMAFCILGMYIGDCTVSNPESVEVSYPNFISEINKIGGKIELPA